MFLKTVPPFYFYFFNDIFRYMKTKFVSQNVSQTKKIAFDFAKKILKLKNKESAVVIGLSGELGSGKTAFAQGFAKALSVKERIHSPTFVLMKKYSVLIHIDAYRIKKSKEIIDLGWKKMINNSENIILVEWVENIKKILPQNYFLAKFFHLDKNKRCIDICHIK